MSDAGSAKAEALLSAEYNVVGNMGDQQAVDDFVEFSDDEEEDHVYISVVPNYQMPVKKPMPPQCKRTRGQLADHPLTTMAANQPLDSPIKLETQPEKISRSRFKINVKDVEWTILERENLICALKKFGLLDMLSVCREVPSKTELQIREFIRVAWKCSRRELNYESRKNLPDEERTLLETPITQWLKVLEDVSKNQKNRFGAYNKMLPKAFLFISKYGNHPEPESCGGINFREAYEFMYHMLSGLPGKSLSPETARYVRKTLHTLSLRARNGSQAQVNFMQDITGIPPEVQLTNKRRCYNAKEVKRQKKSQVVKSAVPEDKVSRKNRKVLLKLIKRPGANPLNVPIETLELSSVPTKTEFVE